MILPPPTILLTPSRGTSILPTDLLGRAMEKVLKPGLGNWVDHDRFFDRETDLALFCHHIRDGTNLLLVAQRRIGKTSMMREAARRMSDEIIGLNVDLQKAETAEDAIVELSLATRAHEGLWRRVSNLFSGVWEKLEAIKVSEISVTLRSDLAGGHWKARGDELFASLASVAEQQNKRVVIFFDEVPILVNRLLKGGDNQITAERRDAADAFMSWLRDNVIRHRGRVVQILTGSIGLEPVLRQAGLNGTLNAYHPFELRPWSPEVGAACLVALAAHRGLPLAPEIASRMVELLGCAIPHHVQMFFDKVHTAYVTEEMQGAVTREFVDSIYERTMTGVRGHPELSHMEERLHGVLAPNQFALALEMLTETAVSGELTYDAALVLSRGISPQFADPRREVLDALNILEHDGYLERRGVLHVFTSNLVRDWWAKRFGQGWIPVMKRAQRS